jgi:hypothetical protein
MFKLDHFQSWGIHQILLTASNNRSFHKNV